MLRLLRQMALISQPLPPTSAVKRPASKPRVRIETRSWLHQFATPSDAPPSTHVSHRFWSAADVNAQGRLAARYHHSSTRGTGRDRCDLRSERLLAITSDSYTRDS